VDQVYQFWRDFANFPQFMEHVEEVRPIDPSGRLTRWKLKGPLGTSVEYDAELTQDQPQRSIGWNSRGGSLETTGAVTFTDLGDYTEVHVVMQWYDPPGGPVGEAASRLFQDPDKMLEEDLQRFKQIVETRTGPAARR
jgi:uncharacterized membrane protein